MTQLIKMELELDALDHKAIIEAIARRERQNPLPAGESNLEGRALAEICRGWQDYNVWFCDDITTEAQQLELEAAAEAGFALLPLKNEIERWIKTIKRIEIIGSGSGSEKADISFILDGQKYILILEIKGKENV